MRVRPKKRLVTAITITVTNPLKTGVMAIPEKRLPASFGGMKISVPRDCYGEFESKLVKKHQTSLTGDIEEKIISKNGKLGL